MRLATSSHLGRPGEGDLVDVHVLRQRSARGRPEPWQDVDDARRDASLLDQLREVEGGERRLLGRFHDHRAAGRHRWSHFRDAHHQREVPLQTPRPCTVNVHGMNMLKLPG